jgi:lipopolysaccharide heptosyltransferase II
VHIFNKRSGMAGLRAMRSVLLKEQYDYALDLHNVLRTRLLRRGLAKHVAVINKRTFKRWLLVRFKRDLLKDALDIIGRYFETATALGVTDDSRVPMLNAKHKRDPKRIAIAPGARHWNKRWPTEHYREVAQALLNKGNEVVFYGSSGDIATIEEIRKGLTGNHRSLADETTITEAAHSLAKCSIAITNDSGLMHVAQAVGTPVIALFGPTVTQFGFAPRAPFSVVLEVEGLYCRPCTAIGLDHCPEGHFRCMKEISPSEVLNAVRVTLPQT